MIKCDFCDYCDKLRFNPWHLQQIYVPKESARLKEIECKKAEEAFNLWRNKNDG